MFQICPFLQTGSLKKILSSSCLVPLSTVLHTEARQISTTTSVELIFCKIFWYLSIASRIRSQLLNMADICSYASNSFPRTPMWLLSLRLCTSPKPCTGCSSAALGGNLFRILLASC